MSRTIVEFFRDSVGPAFKLAANASPVTNDILTRVLDLSAEDDEFREFRELADQAGATQVVGQRLFDTLMLDDAISEQVGAAIQNNIPLFIADDLSEAQALPWEALCRPDGRFLSLHGVPLIRLTSRLHADDPSSYVYDPPLRVLAVLCASSGNTGATALEEWNALRKTLTSDANIDCQLRVIGCDADVKQAVEDAAADGSVPGATFQFLASDQTVVDAASEFQPHILHFFCHGFLGAEPFLELATRGDQMGQKDRGSVSINERALQEVREVDPSLWLVTLNCCLGAALPASGQSLARQVAKSIPAVVAMQEPIDRRDAHLFCRSFYKSLLTELHRALGHEPYEPDLHGLLAAPRAQLFKSNRSNGQTEADSKQWTLPVLYLHPEPLRFDLKAAAGLGPARVAELQSEIATLVQSRTDLQRLSEFPPGVIDQLNQRIDTLKAELLGLPGNPT